MKKKITALLPMKGHSERVPKKNLKIFNKLPLYHHVLKTLLNCKIIDNIVINTDCYSIIEDIGVNFNNEKIIIHERPKQIQGDFVSMNEIIKNDLSRFESDIYIQTHSTNPLLSQKSINDALSIFRSNHKMNFDSIFSVTKIQSRFYDSDCNPINHNPEKLLRTQDLNSIYEENSNFYIFTQESFKNSNFKRIGKKPKFFEISKIEALDIDTLDDFWIAEAIHNITQKK